MMQQISRHAFLLSYTLHLWFLTTCSVWVALSASKAYDAGRDYYGSLPIASMQYVLSPKLSCSTIQSDTNHKTPLD